MSMDPELSTQESVESQQVTLQESAEKAFDTLSGAEPKEQPEKALGIPPTPPEPEFELPQWATRWSEPARQALKAIAGIQHNKGHIDPILKQIEEMNLFNGKREQEYGEYKKSADPVYQVLKPLESNYRMQGMTLEQGVSQLVEGAKFVATDPDQAFPYFAGMYRPRSPAQAVQAIAQQWGVDLGQIVQEQPYIDPSVKALVTPLQQELDRLRQFQSEQQASMQQAERQQQQEIQERIIRELESLEKATDESGNLRYPYLNHNGVFERMLGLKNAGVVQDFDQAYQASVNLDPELSKESAKAAEQRAIQEATAKSERIKQEQRANLNAGGKGRKTDAPKSKTLTDAATAAYEQIYGTD